MTLRPDPAGRSAAARDVQLDGFGAMHVERPSGSAGPALGELTPAVPGRHSVQNALAAVAVGLELDVPFANIAARSPEFRAPSGASSIAASSTASRWSTTTVTTRRRSPRCSPPRAPPSRARDRRRVPAAPLHADARSDARVRRALAGADEVVLTDIYAASEDPIPGVTIEALAAAINAGASTPVHVVPEALDDVPAALADLAQPGDLVITLGAGSIGGVPRAAGGRARTAVRTARDGMRRGAGSPAGRPSPPPADKRFRRARTSSRRAAAARSRARGAGAARAGARRHGVRRLARHGARARRPRAAESRIAVRGNERLSTGEVLALVDGPARPQHPDRRASTTGAAAAVVAVGRGRDARRVLPSTRRDRRSTSGSRWASAASAVRCIWSMPTA